MLEIISEHEEMGASRVNWSVPGQETTQDQGKKVNL